VRFPEKFYILHSDSVKFSIVSVYKMLQWQYKHLQLLTPQASRQNILPHELNVSPPNAHVHNVSQGMK